MAINVIDGHQWSSTTAINGHQRRPSMVINDGHRRLSRPTTKSSA